MAYLSMTRLKLKSARYVIPFLVYNERVVKQIRTSEGFLKGKLLATPTLSMWTTTLWASQEALKAFYLNGTHRIAMAKLNEWSSEAASAHQQVDINELPSWGYISTQLCKIGHFTALKEPSLEHEHRTILSPRVTIMIRVLTPIRT